jgi:hypothetical protein
MPNVCSKVNDDVALTLWWICTKGIPTWRQQVTKDHFSSKEIKTLAGSQTYEKLPGGRKPDTSKLVKKIREYTSDDCGFKIFFDPVQRGYLLTAMKLFLFAKKHEKEYLKQCYVEWGQVPFFCNGPFIVKMVIDENLVEKLKNLLLDCNEASIIKLLKEHDYNFQAAKKVQFKSLTQMLKKYGIQTNKKPNESNKTTLVCFSFFKEVWNEHAHVGLRGAGAGPVQQIFRSYFPTAGAAHLPLATLVAPTTPKRKCTYSAACTARTPTGTPPTVQKRPRTGTVQVEVEEEKRVAPIHDVQHADIMGMQIAISGSAFDSQDNPENEVDFKPWKDPVDAELEQIMETDVDEMSWGDLSSKNEMEWPDLRRVTEYRSPTFATSPPRPPRSSEFFKLPCSLTLVD